MDRIMGGCRVLVVLVAATLPTAGAGGALAQLLVVPRRASKQGTSRSEVVGEPSCLLRFEDACAESGSTMARAAAAPISRPLEAERFQDNALAEAGLAPQERQHRLEDQW